MREWYHRLSPINHLSTEFLLAAASSCNQRCNKFILCSYHFPEVTLTHWSDSLAHFIDLSPIKSNLFLVCWGFLNRLLQPASKKNKGEKKSDNRVTIFSSFLISNFFPNLQQITEKSKTHSHSWKNTFFSHNTFHTHTDFIWSVLLLIFILT